MNKKNFLIISFLVLGAGFFGFILSSQLSSVLAENELLNPGHLWNELECSETLCVTQNGVGIGTINPDESLHITKKIKVGDSVIYDPSRDASPWLFENFVSVAGPGDDPSHIANKGYIDDLLLNFYSYVDSLSISSSPSEFYDTRDGNKYSTVQIGEQCWMAENLRYLPGDPEDTMPDGYYVYGYEGANVGEAREQIIVVSNPSSHEEETFVVQSTYGLLYNHAAAMNACPSGWHLPTKPEWQVLINTLGGDLNEVGGKLKAEYDTPYNYSGEPFNESGFNAVMAGIFDQGTLFYSLSVFTNFWTSTPNTYDESMSYDYCLSAANHQSEYRKISPLSHRNINGFSVRCLKD